MKRIAFVSNDYKTDFFIAVANELVKRQVEVYWFVSNRKIAEGLVEQFGQEKVLLINKEDMNSNPIGSDGYKCNELILQDHSLRYQQNWADKYLFSVLNKSRNFINNNSIECIFGELSRAHECLIYRLCKKEEALGCAYYSPSMVRIPNGRFGFFCDEDHYEIAPSRQEESVDISNIDIFSKPSYYDTTKEFLKNNYTLSGRMKKVVNFVSGKGYDNLDPSKFENRFIELGLRVKREANKEFYRFVKFDEMESLPEKYIFFPLQRYPEASVDVFGRYSEDQLQHIVDLWRVLPDDVVLVVKEHATAIGERPLSFYRELKKYKNILIVSHEVDSHALIEGALATATVTGTAALEAALRNKKSIVFGKPFFERLGDVNHVNKQRMRECSSVLDLIENKNGGGMEVEEYLEYIFAHSYPGLISDPVSEPYCMNQDNIEAVADGFYNFIH